MIVKQHASFKPGQQNLLDRLSDDQNRRNLTIVGRCEQTGQANQNCRLHGGRGHCASHADAKRKRRLPFQFRSHGPFLEQRLSPG